MGYGHICWPAPSLGTFFLSLVDKFRDIKSRQKVRRTSHRTKFGPADLDVHAEGGVPKKELVLRTYGTLITLFSQSAGALPPSRRRK